jgi:hypothetical protein
MSLFAKKNVAPEPATIEDLSHMISNNNARRGGIDDDSDNSDVDDSLLEEKKSNSKKKVLRPVTPPRTAPTPPPQIRIVNSKSLSAPPKNQKKTQDATPLEETHEQVVRKINEYCLRLPKLFTKDELKSWNNGENQYKEDQARALLRTIKTRIIAHRKTVMVNMMFEKACDASEAGMVNFLNMGEMVGFGSYAKESKILFEDDLAEIACEMSDSWIPGAKIRLLMGLAELVDSFKRKKQEELSKK